MPTNVIVTGGASGIGAAVTRAFVQHGAKVGIVSSSEGTIKRALAGELADQIDRIKWHVADVADDAASKAAIDALAGELGGVDAVVASAGIEGEMAASISEVTTDGFRRVLEVNVLGVFHTVKHSLPYLRASTNPSVIIIGSDSGFVSVPGMLAYNASKGAIVQLTRALSVELWADDGIRVNSVCPSAVDTPMARRGMGVENFDDADFPVQTPDDVAWSVTYLASARSRAINGQSLLSDFGYTARSNFPS
jgi:dihydroanticapsin dehydrogenase